MIKSFNLKKIMFLAFLVLLIMTSVFLIIGKNNSNIEKIGIVADITDTTSAIDLIWNGNFEIEYGVSENEFNNVVNGISAKYIDDTSGEVTLDIIGKPQYDANAGNYILTADVSNHTDKVFNNISKIFTIKPKVVEVKWTGSFECDNNLEQNKFDEILKSIKATYIDIKGTEINLSHINGKPTTIDKIGAYLLTVETTNPNYVLANNTKVFLIKEANIVNELYRQIEELQTKVNELNKELNSMKGQLGGINNEIVDVKTKLVELNKSIELLGKDNKELKNNILELNKKLENMQTEVLKLEKSNSGKLTLIIVFVIFLLLIILAVVGFIVYKILNKKKNDDSSNSSLNNTFIDKKIDVIDKKLNTIINKSVNSVNLDYSQTGIKMKKMQKTILEERRIIKQVYLKQNETLNYQSIMQIMQSINQSFIDMVESLPDYWPENNVFNGETMYEVNNNAGTGKKVRVIRSGKICGKTIIRRADVECEN